MTTFCRADELAAFVLVFSLFWMGPSAVSVLKSLTAEGGVFKWLGVSALRKERQPDKIKLEKRMENGCLKSAKNEGIRSGMSANGIIFAFNKSFN